MVLQVKLLCVCENVVFDLVRLMKAHEVVRDGIWESRIKTLLHSSVRDSEWDELLCNPLLGSYILHSVRLQWRVQNDKKQGRNRRSAFDDLFN